MKPVSRRIPLPENGVEIALLDWGGDGPLVFMHHANGFCAGTLGLVAQALVPQLPRDRHGRAGTWRFVEARGAGAYAWAHFAADYLAVAERLADECGGGRVAVGLGHSFGGTSVLGAAAQRPELFGRSGARRSGDSAAAGNARRLRRRSRPRSRGSPGSSKARASAGRSGRVSPKRASTSKAARSSPIGCPTRSISISIMDCASAPTGRSSCAVRARSKRRCSRRAAVSTSKRSRVARRFPPSCCGRATATSRPSSTSASSPRWRTRASSTSTRATWCRWNARISSSQRFSTGRNEHGHLRERQRPVERGAQGEAGNAARRAPGHPRRVPQRDQEGQRHDAQRRGLRRVVAQAREAAPGEHRRLHQRRPSRPRRRRARRARGDRDLPAAARRRGDDAALGRGGDRRVRLRRAGRRSAR